MIAYLASYPKSGSTWLRLMLDVYAAGEPVESCPRFVSVDGSGPIAKTHDAYSGQQADAVIYVTRHPGDVAVSFAHHFGITIDAAIDWMSDGAATLRHADGVVVARLGRWCDHMSSWLESGLPITVIRYEHMLDDPGRELRRAVEVIGLPLDEERLRFAVEETRFTNVQRVERICGFFEKPVNGPFFRSGTSGQWRTELTPSQQERLSRVTGGRHI